MRRILTAIVIGLLWSSLASAATVFSSGFESGNLCPWGEDTGAAISTNPVHTGIYALKMTAADGTGQYVYSPNTLNLPTAYARFYLYVDTASTEGFVGIFVMAPAEARLYFDGLGTVRLDVWNGFTNKPVEGSASINPGTWYMVEIKTVISPTEGAIEEKLNGAIIASEYGINTGTEKITRISPENFTRGDTPNVDIYEDDFAVSDTDYPGVLDPNSAADQSPISFDANSDASQSPVNLFQ